MSDRPHLGLRRVINAAGTMTVLGASAAVPDAIRAATDILPCFVVMDDLQRAASTAIAKATGAEAGFVTASASAGVTLAVAAAMTGSDPGHIARLPDTTGMRNGIAIQRGHLIDYGAPIEQAIRLAGARVVGVGERNAATLAELEAALDGSVAAALYVVSHHTEQSGQIDVLEFAATCGRRDVPLIVDAASEQDLTGFIAGGADLVIYSAHKFLGGLTAGIVAGRKDLVRAAYLQNGGIGRGMKVGKEGIAAVVAALETWARRDHAAHREAEERRTTLWMNRLAGVAGIRADRSPDPTGNPITRIRVSVDATAGVSAWDLADALAEGERPIAVRDDEIAAGYFELDPCNLSDDEAVEVAERIVDKVRDAQVHPSRGTTFAEWSAGKRNARLRWPD